MDTKKLTFRHCISVISICEMDASKEIHRVME
jgi:hypothetical protein